MSSAADVLAHNLRVDHQTALVTRAFVAAGVESVLLKGPSIVRWLYADRPRRYQDCDLLVAPDDGERAAAALRTLGFEPAFDEAAMPGWWREHALEWRGHDHFTSVDLHRSVKGVRVDDDHLWRLLRSHTETIEVGGAACEILDAPARCALLALQCAGDGIDRGDVRRAIALADHATWRDAARIAAALEASDAFAAGLRIATTGEAVATKLTLPELKSVEIALRAARAPAEALTVERLANPGRGASRLGILLLKLFPPPAFMRHWSPLARRGRGGMALAYAQRAIWLARRAPTAVRAWRKARSEAQPDVGTGS